MRAARPTDWETHPLPERRTTIPLDRTFTPPEMRRIRRGVVPEAMEDKWFIYWQDDRLHFHRSWTGYCTYVARFEVEGGTGRMVEAQVSRDPDQYQQTDDARNAVLIGYLVDVLLLRRPVEFPADPAVDRSKVMGAWAVAGRAILGEHPDGD